MTENAYVAGFLDGDGSLMLQVKKRNDTRRGFRFMATICLYQDSRHDEPLYWMRNVFNVGYVSKRNDGITELRVNGFARILSILSELQPFIRFKKIQTEAMIAACQILQRRIDTLSESELRRLVDLVLEIQNENYASNWKKTREELLDVVGLTP